MAKNSKTFTKLALSALALGTAFTAANDAMALERGCQNADTVRAALRDEGQFVVVSGQRTAIAEQPRNIFTSNQNGTLGYNIEQGTGDATGQLCVRAKYTDIRLNSNSDLATPSWALRGTNTPHNAWIVNTQNQSNNRILMGATVLRQENGQDVRGAFMMVTRADNTGLINQTLGSVTVTLSNGNITPSLGLTNVEKVQPNYDAFIQRNTQLASLTRN